MVSILAYECKAVFEQMHLVACVEKAFASVAYAEFSSYSADIDICGVEQFKNLPERLVCSVQAFESGVLFLFTAASLVECKLFACIWEEIVMDFTSVCSGHAVGRPCDTLFDE
jgi:hypothetical protein